MNIPCSRDEILRITSHALSWFIICATMGAVCDAVPLLEKAIATLEKHTDWSFA